MRCIEPDSRSPCSVSLTVSHVLPSNVLVHVPAYSAKGDLRTGFPSGPCLGGVWAAPTRLRATTMSRKNKRFIARPPLRKGFYSRAPESRDCRTCEWRDLLLFAVN